MLYIDTERIPIKSWCESPDSNALEQAKHLARLPFAYRHIALMPDTHEGFGMPIGGVLAAHGHVIPNAVGVDIGCGMCAVRTNLESIYVDDIKSILSDIRHAIPVGFNHRKRPCDAGQMPAAKVTGRSDFPVIYQEYDSACYQLGTLGGGNHFIEIQMGSDGFIWVMLHSGSRNLGKQVAEYHNQVARRLNEKSSSPLPSQWDLASLVWDSEEGVRYTREMNYCLEFARLNRMMMLADIIDIFRSNIDGVTFETPINIHHNYAAVEEHYGQLVVVHRKGATSAYEGQVGIIPGSQGSKSYIVLGKGNPESFQSCSHGAGRRLGRKQAIRELDLDQEIKLMEKRGILHAIRGKQSLDEAPGAYKDIEIVMREQQDLVSIVVKLEPLAVVKG